MKFSFTNATLIAYLAATVIFFLYLAWRRRGVALAGLIVVFAGAALNITAIIYRWAVAEYPPFSNMYESLLLMACAIAVSYGVFQILAKIQALGGPVMALAVLSLGYASFFTRSDVSPLVPALQSNWLTIHVITYFIGYGGLSVSFVASLAYLFKRKPALENLACQAINFSFPFLTIGLITGAVWAKTAWGDYWSWDPKETWALITWLVYLNFLHLRYTLPPLAGKFGWKSESLPKIRCIFSVAGYLTVLFTYFGVNYLLSGLHSYT